VRLFFADFWKNIAHVLGQHFHQFVEERLVKTEAAAIADGAAKDAAQDVVAVVVAGQDSVGYGKT
jgi:hypothetical protein